MAKKKPTLLWRQTTTSQGTTSELYQPGFNPNNSCWLKGKWIKVPNEGFTECAAKHEALYANLDAETAKQYYRDPPTDKLSMTEAQKQAYKGTSMYLRVLVWYADTACTGPANIEVVEDKLGKSVVPWLKRNKAQVVLNTESIVPNWGAISRDEILALGIPQEYLKE